MITKLITYNKSWDPEVYALRHIYLGRCQCKVIIRSTGHEASQWSKLPKIGHWNFWKIITWITCLGWLVFSDVSEANIKEAVEGCKVPIMHFHSTHHWIDYAHVLAILKDISIDRKAEELILLVASIHPLSVHPSVDAQSNGRLGVCGLSPL